MPRQRLTLPDRIRRLSCPRPMWQSFLWDDRRAAPRRPCPCLGREERSSSKAELGYRDNSHHHRRACDAWTPRGRPRPKPAACQRMIGPRHRPPRRAASGSEGAQGRGTRPSGHCRCPSRWSQRTPGSDRWPMRMGRPTLLARSHKWGEFLAGATMQRPSRPGGERITRGRKERAGGVFTLPGMVHSAAARALCWT
jgi:hypothetical protein